VPPACGSGMTGHHSGPALRCFEESSKSGTTSFRSGAKGELTSRRGARGIPTRPATHRSPHDDVGPLHSGRHPTLSAYPSPQGPGNLKGHRQTSNPPPCGPPDPSRTNAKTRCGHPLRPPRRPPDQLRAREGHEAAYRETGLVAVVRVHGVRYDHRGVFGTARSSGRPAPARTPALRLASRTPGSSGRVGGTSRSHPGPGAAPTPVDPLPRRRADRRPGRAGAGRVRVGPRDRGGG
jgi:hypothetical protein